MPSLFDHLGNATPDTRPIARHGDGTIVLDVSEREALQRPYVVMRKRYGVHTRLPTLQRARAYAADTLSPHLYWVAYVPFPLHRCEYEGTGFPAAVLDIPAVPPVAPLPEVAVCTCGCTRLVRAPAITHQQENDFGDGDGFDVSELAGTMPT